MRALAKFCKRTLKIAGTCAYILVATTVTLMSGCVYLTPTRVPPLTKELGFEVPNVKGWTTTGLNDFVYQYEMHKLDTWKTMIDMVNVPALAVREEAIDWLNVGLSAGMFGGMPLVGAIALKKLPKGAVKKEDHDLAVKEAGEMDPEEYKKDENEAA